MLMLVFSFQGELLLNAMAVDVAGVGLSGSHQLRKLALEDGLLEKGGLMGCCRLREEDRVVIG